MSLTSSVQSEISLRFPDRPIADCIDHTNNNVVSACHNPVLEAKDLSHFPM